MNQLTYRPRADWRCVFLLLVLPVGSALAAGAHRRVQGRCQACHASSVHQSPLTFPARGAWDLVWSPAGGRLAFGSGPLHLPARAFALDVAAGRVEPLASAAMALQFASEDEVTFERVLWGVRQRRTLDLRSGQERPLSTASGQEDSPVVSPDGKQIAYCVREGKYRDLYLADADGSNATGITSNFWVRSCTWRSDGKGVLFEIGPLMTTGVWEYRLDTKVVRPLIKGFSYNAALSPDARYVAAVVPLGARQHDLAIVDLSAAQKSEDDKAEEMGIRKLGLTDVSIGALSWRTDSSRLAFGRELGGGSLWSVNARGDDPQRHGPSGLRARKPLYDPTGRWIAFEGMGPGSVTPELFLVATDTGELRRLAHGAAAWWGACYSPDGRCLAFLSTQTRQVRLHLLDRATGHVGRLALPKALSVRDTELCFSRDSATLAVTAGDAVFLIDVLSRQTQPPIPKSSAAASLSWQGKRLVYSALLGPQRQIVAFDPGAPTETEGAGPTVVVERPDLSIVAPHDFLPQVSANGKRLAFCRGRELWCAEGDLTQGGFANARSLTGAAATRRPERTAETPGEESLASLRWSPDGRALLARVVRRTPTRVESVLRVISPLTGRSRDVFAEPARSEFMADLETYAGSPQWLPDGSGVLFVSELDGRPNLYIVSRTGSRLRRLTTDGALFPAISPAGREIAYTSLAGGREVLFRMDSDGGHKQRLFDYYRPDPSAEAPPEPTMAPLPAAPERPAMPTHG